MSRKIILGIMLMSCLLLAGCGDYSSGERAGQIIKFSNKGLFFKTWEGQLNLGGMRSTQNGVVPDIFKFSLDASNKRSVDNELLIKQIKNCLETGKRCKLHYQEEFISAPWRGDTSYFIVKVEEVEQ